MPVLMILALALISSAQPTCQKFDLALEEIQGNYDAGHLSQAIEIAENNLQCPEYSVDERILIHLKLSAIHDRVGLHQNSRPVAESLAHVESAAALAYEADPVSRAEVMLARARFFYRSEMGGRTFAQAEKYAGEAIELFETSGNLEGHADSVHLLGLIQYQRGELESAAQNFENSHAIELRKASPRPRFLADHERHTGFVLFASEEFDQAIPYFERSFTIRKEAGLIDQSLFAAATLARALVIAGRPAEAEAPAQYALEVARSIDSPEGMIRAGIVLGTLKEQLGDTDAARSAFEMTFDIASKIGHQSLIDQAAAALRRLTAASNE